MGGKLIKGGMEIKYVNQFVKEFNKIKQEKLKLSILASIETIKRIGIYKMQENSEAAYLKNHNLYEVKIGKKSRNYRILCAIKDNCCWLLHLFFKKTQQIESKEIKTALIRKKFI
jgi:phage-related protein